MLYAKAVVQPDGFELLFAITYPDGSWAVSKNLEETAPKITLSQMIEKVQIADLVVPHLFCQKGLTSIRTFFEDVLNIPLIGSSGQVLSIAQNKHWTKLLAADAAVNVPKGFRLNAPFQDRSFLARMDFPIIVKPNCTDNSDGLALVNHPEELEEAIQAASHFDEEILVEEFIPGRELRGAVIEIKENFHTLPFIEYKVSETHPIREKKDKYKFNEQGQLLAQSEKKQVPAQCPALIDKALQSELSQMMIALHQRLGCRDFSMYDFRIHHQTGKPYLLEAGLFWSFSEASMISSMLRADGKNLETVTHQLWQQSIRRR